MTHGLTRKATANGIHQLRSVTQSLAWIARQTRPGLSYRMSKIQSTFENACVKDLRECNRIVDYAISTSTRGIYFLQIFLGMTQLSQRSVNHQKFKSQQACITALAPGNALNAQKMLIHPLSRGSTRISRVCRSTLMAACALCNAGEHGLRTRTTIVDMGGQLIFRQCEETASALRKSLFSLDISEYQTSRQQTFGDRLVSSEATHLGQS